MDMKSLIPLALKLSILLAVFAIGLSTRAQDVMYVMRRPGLLARSLLSINVVMPLFVASLVAVTHLQPAVRIGLIALSVSPIPPMLPRKARSAVGDASYAIGLLVVAAFLAIGFVPLAVHVLGRAFGTTAEISPTTIGAIVAGNVLAPMGAGILFHHVAQPIAERMARPLSVVASCLLVVSVLPILLTEMPAILSLMTHGTIVVVLAFVLVGLAAGYLLGGPDPANRAVLALTTSSRHPGIAVAIANANFPQQKLVGAVVLLYLLVNVIIAVLLRQRFGRPHPAAGDGAAARAGGIQRGRRDRP